MTLVIFLALTVLDVITWAAFLWLLPAIVVVDTVGTAIQFYAVMLLKQRRDEGVLPPEMVKIATVYAWFAIACDVLLNLIYAPVIFLDIPREPLFTSRLERYVFGTDTRPPATGWRLALALWLARVLLDWAEVDGRHVKP